MITVAVSFLLISTLEMLKASIRFKWYGENSFNEPADMTSTIDGWEGGFDDSGLRQGAKGYGTWNVYSKMGFEMIRSNKTVIDT